MNKIKPINYNYTDQNENKTIGKKAFYRKPIFYILLIVAIAAFILGSTFLIYYYVSLSTIKKEY